MFQGWAGFNGELKLGFYGGAVKDSSAISDVHVYVTMDGSAVVDQDFSSAAAALDFFTNDALDIGGLGTSGTFDLQATLVVTSSAAGAAFSGSLLAGDVSGGGRTEVSSRWDTANFLADGSHHVMAFGQV